MSSTYIAKFNDFPVQVICTEYLSYTLDDILDNGYKMSDTEWASILFQICFFRFERIVHDYFSFAWQNLAHLFYSKFATFRKAE